ncbi:hypothetical protein L2E82_26993 [Cichorium intybus]|uniref:Uncharacterized protein n=1 Tax=Cichorium intybus TaxID=13427 RepID=A0ACB9CS07_CICIN|nr:hypothetical protein L2E82_26993 [Cichorium intybus]
MRNYILPTKGAKCYEKTFFFAKLFFHSLFSNFAIRIDEYDSFLIAFVSGEQPVTIVRVTFYDDRYQ